MAEKIKVPAGVYDMVTRCMEQEFPDNVAIRYVAEDGKTVVEKHYREYARDIRKMVTYLKNEVPDLKGRSVVLLSRNCYEFCVASYGIILAGGVLVTLNQKKTWDELEYELGQVEPALILNDGIDYGCRAQLEAAYGPLLRPMDCYRDSTPGELTNCVDHDGLMMLMFTSGTTGRSKGVMLSERNMCSTLVTYSEVAENWITNRLPAGQKLPLSHMTLLPLFHMACFVCVMSYPPAGWALNLCGDIRDFYRDLGLMHSDVMASAPMLVETIYNDYKRGRVERLNGLWDLCCSSAALDPKMLEELAANGFVVNQCYGMTETFGDGILNFTQTADHMSAVGSWMRPARSASGATASCWVIIKTPRPPLKSSTRTAGSIPAIWAASTRMATITSRAAKRTSLFWLTARTSAPRSWSTSWLPARRCRSAS